MKRGKEGAMRKQAGLAVAVSSGTPAAGGAFSAGMHDNGLFRRRQARMSPKLIRMIRWMSGWFPMSSATITPERPRWQREVFRAGGGHESETAANGKGGRTLSQQPGLGRRILGTRTAHPYHPNVLRYIRAGREPLRRVRFFGSVTTQASKKVRRSWRSRKT